MHTIIVSTPHTFSIKYPLQLSIACNQTKVNVANFPGNLFSLQLTQTVPIFVLSFL